MPDVTLPEALRDPDAWIVGDRFVGTLWHYHGIVGQQIRELAPAKRAAFYRFVAQRGEPLYLLWDNQALDPVAAEMMAAGARLTEVGSFVRRKVFRVEWPAGVSDAPK